MDKTIKQALIDSLALIVVLAASVAGVTINSGVIDLGSVFRNMLVSFTSIILLVIGFKVIIR